MADAPSPPLPRLDDLTGEFYAWTRQGELRFQRCAACATWRHVPRPMCPACRSTDWTWEPSTGRGTVHTFTVTHRPMHPAFTEVPYAQGIVETDEGVHLVTSIVDIGVEAVAVGLPVEVAFRPVGDGVVLPVYRPRQRGSDAAE